MPRRTDNGELFGKRPRRPRRVMMHGTAEAVGENTYLYVCKTCGQTKSHTPRTPMGDRTIACPTCNEALDFWRRFRSHFFSPTGVRVR